MKNIVYILVCASVIFFTACSSQDKNKKDGTQVLMQDSTEIAGPQRMQVSDVKTSFTYKGKEIVTLEGVQERAAEFGTYLANQGGEQCGFCNPGFIMNVLAMEDELNNPTEEEIKAYLSGNLCRCSGYESQLRAIKNYLNRNRDKE